MGFVEAVEQILRHVPKQRQTLLFSATLPSTVMHVVNKHMNHPIVLKSDLYVDKSLMKQVYYDIKPQEKFSLLTHFLRNETSGLALVFCATRRETNNVSRNLKFQQINALSIHGGLTQSKRLHALNALKNNHINVLVATDVAARGLDIKNVSHVYNYDVPKTPEEYIHRIGRTARAGEEGNAVTLLTEYDHDNFGRILRDRTLHITKGEVPQFEKVFFKKQELQTNDSHYGKRGFHERRNGSYGGYSGGNRSSGGYGRSRDSQSGERLSYGGKSSYGQSSGSSGGFQRSSSGFRGRSHTRNAGNSGNWRR
ncbi:DEAD/DEAH box helicase [Candidatus Woesearchaeota archaeon]|nr:DEAD/DEAH box helicase [Candidatus Woesearchaeota archaeon]